MRSGPHGEIGVWGGDDSGARVGDGQSGVGWPSLRRELKGGKTGSLSKAEGLAGKQWAPRVSDAPPAIGGA